MAIFGPSALGSGLFGLAGAAAKKALGSKKPKVQTPSAPTIDDAAQREQEADRVRRRRGVLANIFGGSGSGAGPTVAKTTLGG
jgi:hypothetical protein